MSNRGIHRASCALVALALLAAAALADESTQGARVPVFEPGFTLSWDGGTIQTDNNGAVPCAVDWNNDGKKDLLVGVFYNGNIYYYPNYGTNEAPVFHDRAKLEADGQEISLSYG